jgi:predicted RNase H-like nuclease (RuvC/YqgF family)
MRHIEGIETPTWLDLFKRDSEIRKLKQEIEELHAHYREGMRAPDSAMNDLDAIKKRHLDPERMQGRTYYEGHIELDLAACVEEIERLRKEVERLDKDRRHLNALLGVP